jgi:glycosyltransferase involved in cell wall biosynthesis
MKTNKETILVTEYYYPDTASTGKLMTDLAVGLQERGLDMTVYTSQPNYHSGENKKQPRLSIHDGVLVKRILAPQVRQSSLIRRLFNWVVFSLWMSIVLLVSPSKKERELVFVSNPPFLPALLWLVCTIRRWDYTYIVHDVYPDQPVELGYLQKEGIVARIWRSLNVQALQRAKNVVALGPVMRDRLLNTSQLEKEDVAVIDNWADESFIEAKSKDENWFSQEHNLTDQFTVLYSGNIGEFHDLETVVKAAAEFDGDDVCILIIGDGDNKEKIVELSERLGVKDDTVRFLPYQPWEDVPYSLTSGDVSIVTVREGFEGICVSSKMYTAMAAGMPILTIAQSYDDEAQIITKAESGIQVPQEDVAGVVEAIRKWKNDPRFVEEQGQNARKVFEEKFTRDAAIDRYYKLLTRKEDEYPATVVKQ